MTHLVHWYLINTYLNCRTFFEKNHWSKQKIAWLSLGILLGCFFLDPTWLWAIDTKQTDYSLLSLQKNFKIQASAFKEIINYLLIAVSCVSMVKGLANLYKKSHDRGEVTALALIIPFVVAAAAIAWPLIQLVSVGALLGEGTQVIDIR